MLHVKSSLDLYSFLKMQNLLEERELYWWPNSGTFEVVIGAILTQNTTWKNVEKSLRELNGFLELESFVQLDMEQLKEQIRSSGYYNQKSARLLLLANNIAEEFGDFKEFQKGVTREWLLAQKGIGEESADSILCYACLRDEMVVDTYTKRFLLTFGIEFKKYCEYKEFLEDGFQENNTKERALLFARYHGMIVEYNKRFM